MVVIYGGGFNPRFIETVVIYSGGFIETVVGYTVVGL
jgi:hypothetical protein